MLMSKQGKHRSGLGRYAREVTVVIGATLVVFFGLALITYNPHDTSWFYTTNAATSVSNACGTVGAHIAGLFFYLFGAASFVVLALCIFSLHFLLFRRSWADEWDRFAALSLLVVVSATLLHAYDLALWGSTFAGGYMGHGVYSSLRWLFDGVGSMVLLYALLAISLMISVRFSFAHALLYGQACGRFVTSRERFLRPVGKALSAAAYYGSRPFVYGAQLCGQVFTGSVFEDGSESYTQAEYRALDGAYEADIHKDPYWASLRTNTRVASPAPRTASPEPVVTVAPRVDSVVEQVAASEPAPVAGAQVSYQLPDLDIFIGVEHEQDNPALMKDLEERAHTLEEKLQRFGVSGSVVAIKRGPVVTLFEYQPEIDSKISKIISLEDDLALALQALSIRIIAPIPGRSVVGFEVANRKRKNVLFANVVTSDDFVQFDGLLPLILGEDTIGNNVIVDLVKMPHVLIAGSTGSGKSVALNAMLVSLLCKLSPDKLKLILIDPKRLEFASYADIAHLLFPIVTDPKRAAPVLKWVVQEMERRYEMMAEYGARNILDYNKNVAGDEEMPLIVVVIDELADLMMTAGRDIEDLIARIAQMARAAGIHMIVATQRPSVDVITGLIKVNFPSRISFRVTSKIDSRTILDCSGADKLLGRGDMLFLDSASATLRRAHGAYVSDQEIIDLTDHIRAEREVEYLDISEVLRSDKKAEEQADELYDDVLEFLNEVDEVSISLLQRRFRIGYNRSARIIDMLEAKGMIMPSEGGKTRKVIR